MLLGRFLLFLTAPGSWEYWFDFNKSTINVIRVKDVIKATGVFL